MALAVNDVVQFTLRGLLFNQRILTVLHYSVSVTTGGSTETQLGDAAADFGANLGGQTVVDKYMACAAPNLTVTECRAQRVSPTRSIYMSAALTRSGGQALECLTPNIAASLEKRTATPGRKGVGRWQLAALATDTYVAGVLTDAFVLGPMTDLATEMMKSWTKVTGGAITFVPCIFNPGTTPPFSPLLAVVPKNTVRTMHRRSLLVGE